MSQHFEVVVIGMHRAGLITAALLAKRGARVLLVDNGESCGTYRRKGLRLPLVPSLVPALDDAPQVKAVFEELALGPALRTSVTPLALQAVLPEHRLEIGSERDGTIGELVAEFPRLEDPIRDFFRRLFALDEECNALLAKSPPLPPANLFERFRGRGSEGRAARLAAPLAEENLTIGIPEEHPLRDLLLAPLALFGHLPTATPTLFHGVRLLAHTFGGAVSYPDPVGGLSALLLNAARDAGVEVHRGAVVRQLALEGRRVTQMQVEDDRMTYSGALFVANTIGPFADLLPPGKQAARFAAEQQAVRPVGTLLTLNLVVRREVIPVGMRDACLLLDGRRLPRDEYTPDPPVFMRRYPAQRLDPEARSRPSSAADDDDDANEVLSIACPAPRTDVQRSPERRAALEALLFERVRRVVPFLDDYLVDRSLAMDTAGWDIEGQNRRVDPLGVHPYFEHEARPLFGITGRPSRTSIKNLLHCGPDVMPGLGVEGEFVAGVAAAGAATKLVGSKWQQR